MVRLTKKRLVAFVLAIFVVACSALDLLMTFAVLNLGGVELNPLMRYVLDNYGRAVCVDLKMSVTVMAIMYLIWVAKYNSLATRSLLFLFWAYSILLTYQFTLLLIATS